MTRRIRFLLAALGLASMTCVWAATPVVDIENSPLLMKACGMTTGISLSKAVLVQDGAFAYLAGFDTAGLNGSLRKLVISNGMDGMPQVVTAAQWDAADILTGSGTHPPRPAPQDRQIFIGKPLGQTWTTVKFSWDSLSESQRDLLSGASAAKEVTGLQRLEYLRGMRSLEIGQPQGMLRKRDRLLGGIVNSNPVHAGEPALNLQGSDYQAFHARHKNRRKAVYVGANDGMLHAFDASDGMELFAYIPNALLPWLSQLTRRDYQHRPYVDGRLGVGEALVDGGWKTILAGGMGGGAQGVFALDVTDPGNFHSGRGAIWEFTDSDDPDMGNVTGTPLIAKFKMGSVKGTPIYKYFVVVANGVNSYRADGSNRFNSEAAGALFLLSLDKQVTEKWQPGVNYFKFKTPVREAALQSGLMSLVAVTADGGVVRFIYAGDLQGNLWRFDFADGIPKQNADLGISLLFTATDDKQKRQPITMQPAVVFAPGGGYVVLFGTGKFLERSDAAAANFSKQSFYGIYDATQKTHSVAGRSELAQRMMSKIRDDVMQVTGNAFAYGVTAPAKKGWYVDFAESDMTGERSMADLALASGKVFFNSLLPGGTCADGHGRSYALNTLTGLTHDNLATGRMSDMGVTSAPILRDVGLEAGIRNAAGKSVAKKRYVVINPAKGGAGHSGDAPAGATEGLHKIEFAARRFAWREVINWQELRAAVSKQ